MENNHSRNVVGAEGVGNIIAFNIFGRRSKSEKGFQLFKSRHFPSKPALLLSKMLVCIFYAEIDYCQMLALLRMNNFKLLFTLLFKKFAQKLFIGYLAVNSYS